MSDETPRCTAVSSRTGKPCQQRPIAGGTVCVTHGGRAPQVVAKAKERLLRAKLQAGVKALGWEPVTDPAMVLSDGLGEMVAFKDMAREQMNELSRWENRNEMGTEDVAARVAIYTAAMRDVANTAAKMISLGIDAAALQLAATRPDRELADQVQRLLLWIGLTDEQKARLPEGVELLMRGEL